MSIQKLRRFCTFVDVMFYLVDNLPRLTFEAQYHSVSLPTSGFSQYKVLNYNTNSHGHTHMIHRVNRSSVGSYVHRLRSLRGFLFTLEGHRACEAAVSPETVRQTPRLRPSRSVHHLNISRLIETTRIYEEKKRKKKRRNTGRSRIYKRQFPRVKRNSSAFVDKKREMDGRRSRLPTAAGRTELRHYLSTH